MLKNRALCFEMPAALFVAMLIPPLNASAEDHSDSWYPVENHANCEYLNMLEKSFQKSRWTGACSGGFVQGEGTITFETKLGEGEITGEYENGILSRFTVISSWTSIDGERQRYEYSGAFRRNGESIEAGYGTFKIGNVLHYSGRFDNLAFNGYGELKTAQFTYAGMFSDGKFNGLGMYMLEEQLTFEGTFKNGDADGAGVLEMNNPQFKLHIVGVFKGPIEVPFDEFEVVGSAIMEFEGEGKYRYTGEIFDFIMHGRGIQVYDTGHRHEGMFEKGQPHGPGIAIDPKGNSCEGEWKDGTLIGRGKGVSKDQSGSCLVDENGNVTFVIVG